mgnify:CR=1 FL=1
MTIHKLRILPIFLLITGLTLTSGCKKKDMSLKLNEPRNIRGVVSYKRSFPDLNDKQMKAIQEARIKIEFSVPDLDTQLEHRQDYSPQMEM